MCRIVEISGSCFWRILANFHIPAEIDEILSFVYFRQRVHHWKSPCTTEIDNRFRWTCSFLGSNQHNAIGCLRTINGCGTGVFQYVYLLNVVRIDVGHLSRIDYSVQYNQRFKGRFIRTRCTQVVFTTHHHAGVTLRVGFDTYRKSGHTRAEHILNSFRLFFFKVAGFQGCHGSGQVFLLHYTVTYHYDLLQCLGVFLHFDDRLLPGFHRLSRITDIRDLKRRSERRFQFVVTVNIGNHTGRCAGYQNVSSDNGLSVLVYNFTDDCSRLARLCRSTLFGEQGNLCAGHFKWQVNAFQHFSYRFGYRNLFHVQADFLFHIYLCCIIKEGIAAGFLNACHSFGQWNFREAYRYHLLFYLCRKYNAKK